LPHDVRNLGMAENAVSQGNRGARMRSRAYGRSDGREVGRRPGHGRLAGCRGKARTGGPIAMMAAGRICLVASAATKTTTGSSIWARGGPPHRLSHQRPHPFSRLGGPRPCRVRHVRIPVRSRAAAFGGRAPEAPSRAEQAVLADRASLAGRRSLAGQASLAGRRSQPRRPGQGPLGRLQPARQDARSART
jgi:hypothetical protein